MEIRYIEFEKFCFVYIIVKIFLEYEGFEKVIKLDMDFGFLRDDNFELLEKFVIMFELDYISFEYNKYFYFEEELFNVGYVIVNFLIFFVWLFLKMIELLIFNKIDLDKFKF